MLLIQLAALALLLAVSAYFALAESAITALSALRMKRLALLAPTLRSYFHDWLSHPHRLLSILMLGNNFVNFGFSSLAAVVALPLYHRWPRPVVNVAVWWVVTAFLLVGGEIVPKIIGRAYRERVAEMTLPLLSRLTRALFIVWGPLGWLIQRFAPTLNRAPVNLLTVVSLEELHHAVDESRASGQIPAESTEMFQRALAFSQKTVRDVAQPADRMDTLDLKILDRPGGAERFMDLLVETGRSRVPITAGGAFVGYLRTLEFFKSVRGAGSPDIPALVKPLTRVAPDRKAAEVLDEFRRTGEAIALVQSPGEPPEGLVTLEDILEEIVGDILDEFDLEEQGGTP